MIMADQKKKQIPLRLSAKLYDAVAAWAEDDFRSVNGQIEYLLTECVKAEKEKRKICIGHLDEHPEFDIKIRRMIKKELYCSCMEYIDAIGDSTWSHIIK